MGLISNSRAYHVPEGARVVEGPGLIVGGLPTRIESGQSKQTSALNTPGSPSPATPQARALCRYSWIDSEKYIKIYLFRKDLPDVDWDKLSSDESYSLQTTSQSLRFDILGDKPFKLHIGSLYAEVDPDKSTAKISDSRICLQLLKIDAAGSWPSLKK